ncbi:hypothetical protein N656DRAFT_784053 [Canariomyces notabilis]|uniref:Heterokaryon incompatibility domain-containing protein n=1 Tax=Canariomyces notabilis TaxID=2074819 RepID=A0AAN6QHX7_9PEZI|nr:hypothetical protein N656DRAFT_784053 [Canariomyces arenarius]
MDRVYSRAFATIIIIPGSDAASGIPGIRPGTRTPLNTETISISDRSATLELNPCSSHIEQVQITASPSPLTLAMDSSTWNTRGWTFQERLLSARCIYITHNAIYFHCHRDILLCETGQATSPATPALSLLNNPLHELQRLDGRVLVNNRIGTAGNDEALLRVVFGVYKGLVAGYSPRKLTFLGDVLNAFAGVFAVITQHLPGAVALCGLPGAFLDLALLWTPVNPLQRREEAVAGLRDLLAATDSNGRCPGWSWAGFVGPVDYRMFGEDEDKRPLPVSLVVDGFKVVHGGKVLRVAGRGVREDDEANQSVMRIGDAAGSDSVSALTDYGPNILQFKAFVVPVTAFLRGARSEYLCVLGQSHATGQQAVYRLYDQDRRHCGLCYEPMVPLGDIARAGQSSFIGIVRHGETDIPFKGPNRVEGDIPLFDRSAYKACGPGSGVVDALLVVWDKDQRDCIARRVSVARIHVKAWERAGPVSKNIALC